jgi:hypothetical protein
MDANYQWQQPYLQALTETEPEQLECRLLEATAAIEQRLLSPIDEAEFRAIRVTQLGLKALRDCSQSFKTEPPNHASAVQD